MTFKVETKRGNQQYPLNSMEISAGWRRYLAAFPELTVDVHDPDFIIYLEVRDEMYVYSKNCAWCSWLADRYVGTWYAVNFRWNR